MADPRVDANRASYAELLAVPGVGAATAGRVLALRPFRDLRDLRTRVRGVGERRERALGRLLCFGPSETAADKAAAAEAGAGAEEEAEKGEGEAAALESGRRLVDLNRATLEELRRLPGVGQVKAQRIAGARPFVRVDDLVGVKGIKGATLDKFRHLICVGARPQRDRARAAAPKCSQHGGVNEGSSSEGDSAEGEGEGDLFEESLRQLEQQEEIVASEWLETELYQTRSADAFAVEGPFPVCQSIDTDVRDHVFDQQRARRQHHDALIDAYQNHYDCTPDELHRDPVVLVASWNIRNVSKKKSTCYLERIAKIIDQFDLVALQEVRDERVLIKLKRLLPGWAFLRSEPVGEPSRRTELFAYFYRQRAVTPTDFWELETPADPSIVRAPFVAHFISHRHAGLSRPLELTLVNVHVSFSTRQIRQDEVAEIRKFTDALATSISSERRSVLVLGDFNLSPIEALGGEQTNYAALIRPPLPTTVFGSLYDNIWINSITTTDANRRVQVDACGVFRIDWRFYPLTRATTSASKFPASEGIVPKEQIELARMQCAIELSDHCPVWAALTT